MTPELAAEGDADWEQVIDRRVNDVVSGKVQLVSGRETTAMARERRASTQS